MTALDAIKLPEKEIKNLPKGERKKAIETRKSFIRFLNVIEKIKDIDSDMELTIYRGSPDGMKELPSSNFFYKRIGSFYYIEVGGEMFYSRNKT